jgi:hypothetical protein
MKAGTYKLLTRFMLSLAVLCFGITSSSAQTIKASQPLPKAGSQPSAQTDTKKLTPPPGKLRGTTNEMRKAAAIRTADRKMQANTKASSETTQGEVKK